MYTRFSHLFTFDQKSWKGYILIEDGIGLMLVIDMGKIFLFLFFFEANRERQFLVRLFVYYIFN